MFSPSILYILPYRPITEQRIFHSLREQSCSAQQRKGKQPWQTWQRRVLTRLTKCAHHRKPGWNWSRFRECLSRATHDVVWRWSEHIKPVVGTESCRVPHMADVLSGKLAVQMEDGTTMEFGRGDLAIAPPGHDGWVVGDEPCVVLDFHGASHGIS
jgi:hypothetical protein